MVFEFPMVFPADGASLVGRVYGTCDCGTSFPSHARL